MASPNEIKFRQLIAPHFDAGFNLARWLTGNDADAGDVLQEACIKSFRFINSLESEDAKPWFLQIVRNTAYTYLRTRKSFSEIDEEIADPSGHAEDAALRECDARQLQSAIDELPVQYREIVILRELEEMSYEDIAKVLDIPIGTVMSRLARARQQLRRNLLGGGRP